ncbi:MAG: hypothetical protein QW134_08345, partial [Nitrososphaeria archaeon]
MLKSFLNSPKIAMDKEKINFPHVSKFINFLAYLTDEKGIIEHSIFSIPDPKEGYCLDDNSRALQVCLRFPEFPITQKLTSLYLKFILSARSENGFHNDLDENYKWEDEGGVNEAFGRAMAALGETSIKAKNTEQQLTATFVFDQMASFISYNISLRTAAQLIIGLTDRILFEGKFPTLIDYLEQRKRLENSKIKYRQNAYRKKIKELADFLIYYYKKNKDKNWFWFENLFSYDNSRIPFSLLKAYISTGEKK